MDDTAVGQQTFRGRVEDAAFITGQGRYADDGAREGMGFAAFVRSPHAHARIRALDVSAAAATEGVIAVLTARDMAGIGSATRFGPMQGRGGKPAAAPHRPVLAGERVMHVGDAVAMVIAEDPLAAQDAAERVAVEYEELAAVTDVRAAAAPGAPQLHPDIAGNLALDWPGPVPDDGSNAAEVAHILDSAKHVARITEVHQRLVVAAMEPRGATARYDEAADRYEIRVCSQGAAAIRDQLVGIMNIASEKLRVVTEDVGGGFGMKSGSYPEYVALLVGARRTGRPVHWIAGRSESFASDTQGRDGVTEAELALDERGRFLALRVRHLQNLGAYLSSAGLVVATVNPSRCFPTVYRIPRVEFSSRAVYSNTVPTSAYRGAGRPEANYVMERLIEQAARVTGIDRATLRRRNFVPPSAMPYRSATGTVYDSGEFPRLFEAALALARYKEFPARRRAARKRGRLRGIGLSCFLEHSGGFPTESARLDFSGDTLTVGLNVGNMGQGHATIFPQIVAERLGIPAAQVRHRHGDTDMDLKGFPAVGSRSTMTAGSASVHAVEVMLEKGRRIASRVLEAAESDIAYRNGAFEIVGTDRRMGLFQLAERAAALAAAGEIAESLDTKVSADTPVTFPNGCHVAEVEIDPQTGALEVVAYSAVDDCGTMISPTLAHGQVHGGIAQGLGQALTEHALYEEGSGQLVTGSFMDYAMPRAHHMPLALVTADHPVPAKTNPLGVKGVGEAGTTASLAAIMNAIADAIPGEAGARLQMPATPQKIWQALRAARLG
ncbi:MAG: xanthine dehydrogenase family protein molybdopterin-binding subunit [Pseudorhodoplanes sp.]